MMKHSQKKKLILCFFATFFTTQHIQTSFDCSCLSGCLSWFFSKCKKTSRQQNIDQQAPIITVNPFQAFEEEMEARTAHNTDQLPLPEYSNVKFAHLLEIPELSVPHNSLNNLSAGAAEQHSRSSSEASSFDSCSTSPTKEIKKDK
ncbi:MAG: hypothetical protein NTZ68_03745 [Candidatus Dependentiae bacterium]|nr:hypothetical protein [Candidatus Dependentiae bacterium]